MEECVFISQLGFISEHVSSLCFTEKKHFLPVFTEKRALFQHILRDAKSTKCELKEHLWERAMCDSLSPLELLSPSTSLGMPIFYVVRAQLRHFTL